MNEADARLAMVKDRGLGYSDVCAAAAIDKSEKDNCEKDMQARGRLPPPAGGMQAGRARCTDGPGRRAE